MKLLKKVTYFFNLAINTILVVFLINDAPESKYFKWALVVFIFNIILNTICIIKMYKKKV